MRLEYILFSTTILFAVGAFYNRNLYAKERCSREQTLKDLNILSQQQTFFIRKMIHEMNTPLSAIELHLSVLLKEHCSIKHVEMIKSSTRMLATIYDDIAFHAGKEKICYPPEWIKIEDFIANRMLYFDTMASVRNIFLELQADSGFYIYISKTELQRIVDNTLSNAIKFSTSSSSIIDIIISYDGKNLNLIFKDTGIGMNQNEIDNLFKAYYRTSSNIQGLGLGLSIIKEICEDYNISIDVKSIKKQGSTFAYKIPKDMVSKKSKDVKNESSCFRG